jgi:hypothetical protein
MKNNSKAVRIFSIVLYGFGVILGVSFLVLYVWANIEASLFDPGISGERRLTSLRCPIAITDQEVAVIKATVNNPLEREINRLMRLHISEGMVSMKRQINTQVELAPGERMTLEWEAYPEDAAFERLIMVRGYLFRHAPLPASSASCGILVLNVPFLTGGQIALLAAIGSFLSMGAGTYLWFSSNNIGRIGKQRHLAMGMVALASVIVLGIVISFFGMWHFTALLLFAAVVLVLGILTYILLGY